MMNTQNNRSGLAGSATTATVLVACVLFISAFFSLTAEAANEDKEKKPKKDSAKVLVSQTSDVTATAAAAQGAACNYIEGEGPEHVVDMVSVPYERDGRRKRQIVRVHLGIEPNRVETLPIVYKVRVDSASKLISVSKDTVMIPAGQTKSDSLIVRAEKSNTGKPVIGETAIVWKREKDANQKDYQEFRTPVLVWDTDNIVDYNALDDAIKPSSNKLCYDKGNPPTLVTGLEDKIKCGKAVKKVATDGQSYLLMKLKAPRAGEGCFKIIDDGWGSPGDRDPDPGTTSPVDFIPTELLASSNVHWAFSTYTPPSDFVLMSEQERKITFEIAYTPLNPNNPQRVNTTLIEETLTLRRPPVLLVHGIWSSRGTWNTGYLNPSPSGGWTIEASDYSPHNDAEFGVITPGLNNEIKALITRSRKKKKTATTQIDIVAHSMGNLISRKVMDAADYRRPENFDNGDVRKLVSLTAPFLGTQMANLLINVHNNFSSDPHNWNDFRIKAVEKRLPGGVHRGAVCDLAENSPGIASANVPTVRGFAFTVSGGVRGQLHPPLDKIRMAFLGSAGTHIDPYVFQAGVDNDALVAVDSQQGNGLPAIDNPGLVHADIFGIGITGDGATAQQVFRKLDSKTGYSNGLPQLPSTGNGVPRAGVGRGAAIDAANYTDQCAQGAPMRRP